MTGLTLNRKELDSFVRAKRRSNADFEVDTHPSLQLAYSIDTEAGSAHKQGKSKVGRYTPTVTAVLVDQIMQLAKGRHTKKDVQAAVQVSAGRVVL